ncbi:MAG TPA: glycogen debranching protein [Nocardioidaceae bacterium]|nr:glycogen debranching protein [Nocardioidaceae bacterium]
MARAARSIRRAAAGAVLATATVLPGVSAVGAPGDSPGDFARSPELSETSRLDDRRSLVVGDRAYSMSTADSLYPAAGWHIRGEMGGVWTPPIKLVDGIWFRLADEWLGDTDGAAATRTTVGWGYTRTTFEPVDQIEVQRTDFVPDGTRATLVGLTLTSPQPRTVPIALDAHSELMSSYPWGWSTPDAGEFNLQDEGSYDDGALLFRETGRPPVPNAEPHDWAAMVAGSTPPRSHELGPDHRGPQDPAVVCPAEGEAPERCDDGEFGKGTGGQLRWQVQLERNEPKTLWFAVAGSDQGVGAARAELAKALADPAGALTKKVAARKQWDENTQVELPGDPLLERSIAWSKQNLLDSVQEAHDLELRDVDEGKAYPPPQGTLDEARWLGAGWPDYPWLFGTDGEYTAFASVAMGQFEDIKAHLRALREVSEVMNGDSGKVVHEVVPDGSVYYGTLDSEGNTDETSKFPSAVALIWRWTGDDAFRDEMYDFTVRNMRYVVGELDEDGDGWPEGLGNVERAGMGEEKLDNTVYTIRGLRDLADLARSKSDEATATWASERAAAMEERFEQAWWYGGDTHQYADSIDDPDDPANDNTKILQRHWIGVTPMDAELVREGEVTRPLATDEHGHEALEQRQKPCYSGEFGLFHTGTGPTSAEGGNKGPACDSAVSTVQSERSVFSLNTGIMAVAEGNFGRLGEDEQQRYTTGNARIQLDPSVWEMPGAMPEIAPSPDFEANIDRPLYDRSMVLQAWGTYGTLWPVVHHQLGVAPDIGRDRLEVVPQVPDGQTEVSGRNVRLGSGSVDVAAARGGSTLSTTVTRGLTARLLIGHVLPDGAEVTEVTLDGEPVEHDVRSTARGREVVVDAGSGSGTSELVVTYR